jgi:hypothetical protein
MMRLATVATMTGLTSSMLNELCSIKTNQEISWMLALRCAERCLVLLAASLGTAAPGDLLRCTTPFDVNYAASCRSGAPASGPSPPRPSGWGGGQLP